MADARGRAHRKANAANIDAVEDWIARVIHPADFTVREIAITCPEPAELLGCTAKVEFVEAFRKRSDSELHSMLKYVAWHWLRRQPSLCSNGESEEVFFEQRIYFPYAGADIEYVNGEPPDNEFDARHAQLVAKGADVFYGDAGTEIVVDVFGKGRNIEVGKTEPRNLVDPLLAGLSESALWVPFPGRLQPKDFSLHDYKFRTLTAYEIEI